MTDDEAFRGFVERVEPRLRGALIAASGPERGWEATAEALAWAWEHWDEMDRIAHPVQYLFRVGRSKTRPRLRPRLRFQQPPGDPPWVEPGLQRALETLSTKQRMAVVLVHALGRTQAEAAGLMGVGTGTVKTHLDRGLAKLRAALEVDADA